MPTPDVPSRIIPAGELLQHISRSAYRGTALHFGRSGGNRYDDRTLRFGTLYVGFDLATALMESVFRQHRWSRRAKRVITRTEVYARMVRAIGVLEPLSLADLTAPGVMASQFGLNLSQLASRRYVHTQRIASLVHALAERDGAPRFDGVLYPSRNNHPAACAALFDRAAAKLSLVDDIALRDHADWPSFLTRYQVFVLPV
ncbi:MAG: RES family NAD+ phosphorylase [Piscinibacter sp.]|uniref:RES family NAD+ phosphorylase n=1 Tax=Piscinibacter TaxID=1114981 RepID=UPI000FDE4FD0|nr:MULTISPECIES: RES family NAD+ phosphorylase [Piscinibacter]MCW5663635.1 RES family NAD+ phosphorylase [Piscinibacter sp.]